jgi:hypothetical protein
MFFLARTAMARKSRICGESVPIDSRSARRRRCRPNRRMEIVGPSIGQAQVDHRRRDVDAAADARGDALDHAHDVVGVAEAHLGALEPSKPLDVHLVRTVDQHVAHGRVGQQRRQRAHPDRLVGQLFGQADALGLVERHGLRLDRTRRELLHRRGHVGVVAVEQASLANLVEQFLVQGRLDRQVVGPRALHRLHAVV